MVEALETPTEVARALVVPQWCVDPADSRLGGELSSLDLGELRRQAADGTARLCLQEGENSAAVHFGAEMIEAAVDRMDGEGVPPALRGADTRHSGEGRWSKKTGTALLQSDAVSPAIVVDLWSAPALFLRHIEVGGSFFHADGCLAVTRGWFSWKAAACFCMLLACATNSTSFRRIESAIYFCLSVKVLGRGQADRVRIRYSEPLQLISRSYIPLKSPCKVATTRRPANTVPVCFVPNALFTDSYVNRSHTSFVTCFLQQRIRCATLPWSPHCLCLA